MNNRFTCVFTVAMLRNSLTGLGMVAALLAPGRAEPLEIPVAAQPALALATDRGSSV